MTQLTRETPNYIHLTFTMHPDIELCDADECFEGDGVAPCNMDHKHYRSTDYDVADTWPLPSCFDKDRWTVSDSGTISADEGDYDFAYREIVAWAWVSTDELEKFRNEWDIEPENAEPALGFLGAIEPDGIPRTYDDERHNANGMEWNTGGWTPVMFADISIIGPDARPA